MRRRMYLAELVAEPPAAPKRRRAARRLPPEEEILEEEEEEGSDDEEAMTAAVRALEPVALVADDAVFGAAGRRSVVEKNWVPMILVAAAGSPACIEYTSIAAYSSKLYSRMASPC